MITTPNGRQLTTCAFDLDETLYPRSSGVMVEIGARIHRYLIDHYALEPDAATALRRDYYLRYGTALRGLQVERTVDTEDYLEYVHDVDLVRLLAPATELDAALEAMPVPWIPTATPPGRPCGRP